MHQKLVDDTRSDAVTLPKAERDPQTPQAPSQLQRELNKPRKSRARWIWLLLLLAAALGVYFELAHRSGTMASTAPVTPAPKAGAKESKTR